MLRPPIVRGDEFRVLFLSVEHGESMSSPAPVPRMHGFPYHCDGSAREQVDVMRSRRTAANTSIGGDKTQPYCTVSVTHAMCSYLNEKDALLCSSGAL